MRATLLLLAAFALPAAGQTPMPYPYNPAYITGAPYTAHATSEMDVNGQPRVETQVLARASNGSTFTSHFGTSRSGEKVNWFIAIVDVPNGRFINVNPRNHTYTIQSMNPYSVITAAQAAEALRQEQIKPLIHSPQTSMKVLGEQQKMGFTTFGVQKRLAVEVMVWCCGWSRGKRILE